MRQASKAKKKVPTFWWDFDYREDGTAFIIIESDNDKYPVVHTIAIPPAGQDATKQIEEAEQYISDLCAGRIVIK